MDTQRDEAFEAEFAKTNFYKGMVESLKNSDCPLTSVFEMRNGKYRNLYIQLASDIWQAKASAAPEGFVLVPKEPTKDTLIEIASVCIGDDFANLNEARNLYKASIKEAIEAREVS